MPNTLQDFLADSTVKAAQDLEAALLQLPNEKWNWSAGGQARSALNMVAECALMNGRAVGMIQEQDFPGDFAFIEYRREIAELCLDWPRLQKLLHDNTALVAQVIRAAPSEEAREKSDILFYPSWNMSYHTAQINFIAAMLGCSK